MHTAAGEDRHHNPTMPQTKLKAVDGYDEALKRKASQKKSKEDLVELDRCDTLHLSAISR